MKYVISFLVCSMLALPLLGFDYLEYENGQLKNVRCMVCGVVVASMMETPSQKYPDRTFSKLRIYPNYRKRLAKLNDGSSAAVTLCDTCFKDDTLMHKQEISEQLKRGFEIEAQNSGEDVLKVRNKYKFLQVVK